MMHTSHPEVIKRLKRGRGHLDKVIKMIEQEKPCLELAQQLQAVCAALANAKTLLVQDHIESCIELHCEAKPSDIRTKMRELKDLSKYL